MPGSGASRRVWLAVFAAALGSVRAAGAQTVVAGPTATDVLAAPGERFTLPIAVDLTAAPSVKLGAYRLSLRWKPALLSFLSADGGTFGAPAANTDSVAQGVLKLAAANALGASGVVTIANVTFRVLSTAAADTFKLAFQELAAAGSFADLLPGLSVTTGLFCGGAIWGDLDGDALVKALDAQIVLMHAVGLPVSADTTLGDVDGDGKANPRDALIILSRVVGLDVSLFRVGRFTISSCVGSSPKTVTVVPAPVALAVGDLFRLSAEVRDSTGKLLVGKNLAWSSSDTSVVKVDSTGRLAAVAEGTATITAAAAPAVSGTAAVTVGPRHRWVVNPSVAQGKPGEVGSDTYPFSTIKQAFDRASPGDTVALGVATYTEPLSTGKALVILGDSGPAGMPVISMPDGQAGVLTIAGKQVIRRVVIGSSRVGLLIQADSVELSSVAVRSSDGPALTIFRSRRTDLQGVNVSTAGGAGIWVDSTGGGVVRIVGTSVGGVGAVPIPLVEGSGYKVYAAGMLLRADSVSIASSRVAGISRGEVSDTSALFAGILTRNTKRTLIQRTTITDVVWSAASAAGSEEEDALGIGADSTGTLEVRDSVAVERVGGSAVAMRGDTLRVLASWIRGAGGVAIDPGFGYRVLEVSDVAVQGARGGVQGEFGRRASIRRSEFQQVREKSGLVPGADTTLVDSVSIGVADQSGYACGVVVDSNAVVTSISHARIRHQGFGLGVCSRDSVTTGDSAMASVGYVAITNTVIEGPYTAVHVHADSLLLVQDSLRAVGWGLWLEGGAPRQTQWVRARDLSLGPLFNGAVVLDSAGTVELVEVHSDSAQRLCWGCSSGAITVGRAGTVRVDSSRVTDPGGVGLLLSEVGYGTAAQNLVQRSVGAGIMVFGADSVRLAGNTVQGVLVGPQNLGGLTIGRARVRAVAVNNRATGNQVSGILLGDTVTQGLLDTNLVTDNGGAGLSLFGAVGSASGRLNTARRNTYGIFNNTPTALGWSFQFNNIEANSTGVLNLSPDTLDVRNNWWGDPKGPRCAAGCDSTSLGDLALGLVRFLPPASDTIAGAPAGAPPVARVAGASSGGPVPKSAGADPGVRTLGSSGLAGAGLAGPVVGRPAVRGGGGSREPERQQPSGRRDRRPFDSRWRR